MHTHTHTYLYVYIVGRRLTTGLGDLKEEASTTSLVEGSKSPLPTDKDMGAEEPDLDIMSWCWSIMAAAAAAEEDADLLEPEPALICWLRNLEARLAESS